MVHFDEIDTVDQAWDFCLVGYAIGLRPNVYILTNFVKNWGKNVKFEIQRNGWIIFSFPTALERDKILNGGPYMILGKHLFLKMLPGCFLLKAEDMNFIPIW